MSHAPERYFEDYTPGAVFTSGAIAVSEAEIIDFARSDAQYGVQFPGLTATYPTGVEAFIEANARDSSDPKGVEKFIRTCVDLTHESRQAGMRVGLRELDDAVTRFPLAFKYRMATTAEVVDEFITDERGKDLCGVLWPHLGVPPSRASFVVYAGQLTATLETGPFYPRGSFQQLADALVAAVELGDGELVYGTRVTGIGVVDERVTGVSFDSWYGGQS